jgi:hypothetical protein
LRNLSRGRAIKFMPHRWWSTAGQGAIGKEIVAGHLLEKLQP